LFEALALGLAHHAPYPLPVTVLAHRPHPQILEGSRITADQQSSGLENALPQKVGNLIHQDDVNPALGSQIGQRHGKLRLQPAPGLRIVGARQDPDIEIAIGPGRPGCPGAEDQQGRDSRHRLRQMDDLLIQGLHARIVAPEEVLAFTRDKPS